MGGHGNHHHIEGNSKNIQESNEDLTAKIRSIELIKHSPNTFHMNAFTLSNIWTIIGGFKTGVCTLAGSAIAWQYYAIRLQHNPAFFYQRIMIGASRVILGAAVGTGLGYAKFGDR